MCFSDVFFFFVEASADKKRFTNPERRCGRSRRNHLHIELAVRSVQLYNRTMKTNGRVKEACSVVLRLSCHLFCRIEHNRTLPPALVANHPFPLHLEITSDRWRLAPLAAKGSQIRCLVPSGSSSIAAPGGKKIFPPGGPHS